MPIVLKKRGADDVGVDERRIAGDRRSALALTPARGSAPPLDVDAEHAAAAAEQRDAGDAWPTRRRAAARPARPTWR